jgi:hypothetical protein
VLLTLLCCRLAAKLAPKLGKHRLLSIVTWLARRVLPRITAALAKVLPRVARHVGKLIPKLTRCGCCSEFGGVLLLLLQAAYLVACVLCRLIKFESTEPSGQPVHCRFPTAKSPAGIEGCHFPSARCCCARARHQHSHKQHTASFLCR